MEALVVVRKEAAATAFLLDLSSSAGAKDDPGAEGVSI